MRLPSVAESYAEPDATSLHNLSSIHSETRPFFSICVHWSEALQHYNLFRCRINKPIMLWMAHSFSKRVHVLHQPKINIISVADHILEKDYEDKCIFSKGRKDLCSIATRKLLYFDKLSSVTLLRERGGLKEMPSCSLTLTFPVLETQNEPTFPKNPLPSQEMKWSV